MTTLMQDVRQMGADRRIGPRLDLLALFVIGERQVEGISVKIVRLPMARPQKLETLVTNPVPIPADFVWWCAPRFAPVVSELIWPNSDVAFSHGCVDIYAFGMIGQPPAILAGVKKDNERSMRLNAEMGCYLVEFGQ